MDLNTQLERKIRRVAFAQRKPLDTLSHADTRLIARSAAAAYGLIGPHPLCGGMLVAVCGGRQLHRRLVKKVN